MCKRPPVYIKYTHLSLPYWLCVFQVYNRWCVCMYKGRVAKFPSLRQIGYNSAEFKKKMAVICEIFGGFLEWNVALHVHCMYMYHLFQTDIFYHLKNGRHADIAISLSRLSFFHQQGFLAVRSGKWRKSK